MTATTQTADTHTFLVPAYGRSPYLRACLQSLAAQSRRSDILISTSTPFDGLEAIAEEFGARVYVHGPNQGMAHDWNMGLAQITSEWVTVAHQDDVYRPTFAERVMAAIRQSREPNMVFTNYVELVGERLRQRTLLLTIKQVLLGLGFLGRREIGTRWSKMNCLRFGCPIPCPSVTFRTHHRPPHFANGYRVNMDWAAWIRKAQEPGSFVWVREPLMVHRIHAESGTSEGLSAGHREKEDLDTLSRLWPRPIARAIARTYAIAYASNRT